MIQFRSKVAKTILLALGGQTMPTRLLQACTAVFFLILFSNFAYALHEIDHRFTVSGHVRDDVGKGQGGQAVVIKDPAGGSSLGKATSGSSGFYSIKLHLHNEDLGKNLEVSTGTRTKEIRVDFDPDNVKDERSVEVNFGAEPIAVPIWENPTALAISGGAIICIAAYLLMKRKRQGTRFAKQGGKFQKKRKSKK